MSERFTKNPLTTTIGIVLILVLGVLIFFEKIHINDATGIVALVMGAGGVALLGAKDKRQDKNGGV